MFPTFSISYIFLNSKYSFIIASAHAISLFGIFCVFFMELPYLGIFQLLKELAVLLFFSYPVHIVQYLFVGRLR